jgi:hypothetical protein
MATVQLLGRGTYGPNIPMGPGVSPLWQYKKSVPAQNTVVIYKDGTVEEMQSISLLTLLDDVKLWIYGGTDYRTTVGSWEYNVLTAAGYTWREVPAQDQYTAEYQDNYNEAWGKALYDENAAAIAAAQKALADARAAHEKAALIATLEATLAALKGTP